MRRLWAVFRSAGLPQVSAQRSSDDVALSAKAHDLGGPDTVQARILLVEDVQFNQVLISTVLKKAGADVAIADNGLVACEMVEKAENGGHPFDLVLMDMQMPVLDGYQASRRLRAAGCSLPIIALTAHAMEGDREKCIEAGCTEYLTKPLDRRLLLQLCRRLTEPEPEAPLPKSDSSAERRAS